MSVYCVLFLIHEMMNEHDFGHVMLLWYPHWLYDTTFLLENISILMSFVKEDADVDYISLDLHLIKCTLISEWSKVLVSSCAACSLDTRCNEIYLYCIFSNFYPHVMCERQNL